MNACIAAGSEYLGHEHNDVFADINPYPTNVENRVSSQKCQKIADWQMGCFCDRASLIQLYK